MAGRVQPVRGRCCAALLAAVTFSALFAGCEGSSPAVRGAGEGTRDETLAARRAEGSGGIPEIEPDGPPLRSVAARNYVIVDTSAAPEGAAGEALLVPLALAPGIDPDALPVPTVEGGAACRAELWRVGVARRPGGTGARRVAGSTLEGWLSGGIDTGMWGATRATREAEGQIPLGAWVLEAQWPGAEVPGALRMAGARIALHRVEADLSRGRAVLHDAARTRWAGASAATASQLLRPALDSPLSRWRAEIAISALAGGAGEAAGASGGGAAAGLVAPAGAVRIDDERDRVIRSLGAQVRRQWEAAIALLATADAPLAASVAERLLLAVRQGPFVVPAWPPESAELDRLLDALLDADATGAERAAAAGDWLRAQPAGVNWVVDDAGQVDAASGDVIVTVAAANLSGEPAVCWARQEGAAGGPGRLAEELEKLAPGTIATTTALFRAAPGESATGIIRVHGAAEQRLGVLAGALPVRPPGASIGPLSKDWTCQQLLAARGGVPPAATIAEAPTAARLFRTGTAAGKQDGWAMLIECAEVADASVPAVVGGATDGFVRVWVGPFERPLAVWRIAPDGTLSDETRGTGAAAKAEGAAETLVPKLTAQRDGSRWKVLVPLSGSLVGPDLVLRLGLERVDAQGRRSAWPRAMLPWQSEPGRAAFGLGEW